MILTRLKEWRPDHHACSISPITDAIGALMGGGAAQTATTPTTPASTVAQPVQQPVGTPQGNASGTPKPQAPTFLGAAATPPVQSGSKTLLGA
jgi:hypothetical protein